MLSITGYLSLYCLNTSILGGDVNMSATRVWLSHAPLAPAIYTAPAAETARLRSKRGFGAQKAVWRGDTGACADTEWCFGVCWKAGSGAKRKTMREMWPLSTAGMQVRAGNLISIMPRLSDLNSHLIIYWIKNLLDNLITEQGLTDIQINPLKLRLENNTIEEHVTYHTILFLLSSVSPASPSESGSGD